VESVFRGMAKAIIDDSDYQSVGDSILQRPIRSPMDSERVAVGQ